MITSTPSPSPPTLAAGTRTRPGGISCSHALPKQRCQITLTGTTRLSVAFSAWTLERVKTNELGSFTQSYDYPTPDGLHYLKLSGPYEDPEGNTKSCELSISWRSQRLR